MFCKNCGAQLLENDKFCCKCGSPVEKTTANQDSQEMNMATTPSKYSGRAIAGFVLSLVGIIVAAIPCGIIGLVFSAMAMKEFESPEKKGKGLAIAGLVISLIEIVIGIINLAIL